MVPNRSYDTGIFDVELEAGVTVYVFVESAWIGGGGYTLTVEAL